MPAALEVPHDLPVLHARVLSLLGDRWRGGTLVDLGSGCGALGRQLAALPGTRVVGIDLVADRSTVLADLNVSLPLGPGTAQGILAVEIFEHVENHYLLAREIARVLAPGGIALITTPNITSYRSRLRFALTGFFVGAKRPLREHHRSPLDHINVLPYWKLRHALAHAQLTVVNASTDRYLPHSFFARLLTPLTRYVTRRRLLSERDAVQRVQNATILEHLTSHDLLYGRSLIVIASKRATS